MIALLIRLGSAYRCKFLFITILAKMVKERYCKYNLLMELIPLLVVLILKIIILKFRFFVIFLSVAYFNTKQSLHNQDVFVKINHGNY